MKGLFGSLATLGGLAAVAALVLMFCEEVIHKGSFAPDTFDLRLLGFGSTAYVVGQLAFISFGGKIKRKAIQPPRT